MISNKDRNYMERAIKVASASTERQRHGCVLTKGGSVIGVGVNTFRNHPCSVSNPNNESSYHAEIMALKATSLPVGATAYVARVNRQGVVRMSMPCIRCAKALRLSGIKRVLWSTDSGEIEEMSL